MKQNKKKKIQTKNLTQSNLVNKSLKQKKKHIPIYIYEEDTSDESAFLPRKSVNCHELIKILSLPASRQYIGALAVAKMRQN